MISIYFLENSSEYMKYTHLIKKKCHLLLAVNLFFFVVLSFCLKIYLIRNNMSVNRLSRYFFFFFSFSFIKLQNWGVILTIHSLIYNHTLFFFNKWRAKHPETVKTSMKDFFLNLLVSVVTKMKLFYLLKFIL
jgi:hypothetical protein